MKRWGIILILGFLAGQALAASGAHKAGLVIRYGNGHVETYCVSFDAPAITGVDLLQRAGVHVVVDPTSSFGQAVCKIKGEGCDYPLDDCFCQCQNLGQTCTYWAYYHLKAGQWVYSGEGAGTYKVHDGDVEGWAWGQGSAGSGVEPPLISFDQICGSSTSPIPSPTPTPPKPSPSPLPTASPTRTSTPTPTPCAGGHCAPSPTPSPPRSPLRYTFTVDRSQIQVGTCATLRWDVIGADVLLLERSEQKFPIAKRGEMRVCPSATTTYTLVMQRGTERRTARLVLAVLSAATSTPTSALEPTRTPAPTVATTPTSPRKTVPPTSQVQPRPTAAPPTGTSTPSTPSPTVRKLAPTPTGVLAPRMTLPAQARVVTPVRPLPYKLRHLTPTPGPRPTSAKTRGAEGKTLPWTHGWPAYAIVQVVLLALSVGVYWRQRL